jgi:methyl-accepting chemotaxis protein
LAGLSPQLTEAKAVRDFANPNRQNRNDDRIPILSIHTTTSTGSLLSAYVSAITGARPIETKRFSAAACGFLSPIGFTDPLMALVKTSDLAAKARAETRPAVAVAIPVLDTSARPLGVRRQRDRSRLRQQKAAERIGAATEELASGVAEAAAATEELRRSLESIAAGAEEAAGAAHESLSSTTDLATRFSEGRVQAEAARRRIEMLQSSVFETSAQIDATILAVAAQAERQMASVAVIAKLRAQAESIGATTATVADISDRTNLLALNAAIEAARAGDEGKGFAVVADEVRAFAETAERSSRDVSDHAGTIVAGVRAVAEGMTAAAATASTQMAAARRVTADLAAIRAKFDSLSQNSQAILTAAIEADMATREAQRGSEIVASAAEEQSAAAAEAQRAVEQQSTALEESQKTAQSLAVLADDLLDSTKAASRSEEVSAAAEELSATVQELAGAAGEILVAIEQISRGAEAQAAATLEANMAMAQIEKSAALTHKNADAARVGTDEIAALLASNRQSIETIADGIAATLAETRRASDALAGLSDIGFKIERTVDKIVLVAVQTSMLAVSGSVEAARAGEAGRGFALVSSDIRKLASDAADNIDGIKDVVRAVQSQIAIVQRELEVIVQASESEIGKARMIIERLVAIETDVAAIAEGNTAILAASQSILTAAAQVQSGTAQIAAVAQEASAAATEAASAARQQTRGAEDLAAAVEEIASLADELQLDGL